MSTTPALTVPVTPLAAAQWANEVGIELAKLLPGGETFERVLGRVKYDRGFISLVNGVGGADHSYAWVKPLYYTTAALVEGHGFVMHGRDLYSRPGSDKLTPLEAAKLIAAAVEASHFA